MSSSRNRAAASKSWCSTALCREWVATLSLAPRSRMIGGGFASCSDSALVSTPFAFNNLAMWGLRSRSSSVSLRCRWNGTTLASGSWWVGLAAAHVSCVGAQALDRRPHRFECRAEVGKHMGRDAIALEIGRNSMCAVSTSLWPIRRASSNDSSMTFLTREVGMICWTRTRSFLPIAASIRERTEASADAQALNTR